MDFKTPNKSFNLILPLVIFKLSIRSVSSCNSASPSFFSTESIELLSQTLRWGSATSNLITSPNVCAVGKI